MNLETNTCISIYLGRQLELPQALRQLLDLLWTPGLVRGFIQGALTVTGRTVLIDDLLTPPILNHPRLKFSIQYLAEAGNCRCILEGFLLLPIFLAQAIWSCKIRTGPPLWSSGQSSWRQIQRPGFDSQHCKKKVVGLKRGPLSLVSTTEELLDRKVAAPV
jgi:hypothetical protein